MKRKAAIVAVVGRPSAGKSTFLNAACGHKVSIVSPVPQTTRNRVRGIVTTNRGQIAFIDTPGFHRSERRLNLRLRELVTDTIDQAELVLYIVDTSRPVGPEEEELAGIVAGSGYPTVIALNKIDVQGADAAGSRDRLAAVLPETRFCSTVLAGPDPQGLDQVLDHLFDLAPDGEDMYPAEIYTDQEPRFRVAEIIREAAISRARKELPHSIYVDVADMEVDEENGRLWIRAFVVVERESQKGIVVGKGGTGIRDIRKGAQRELGRLFPYRIELDLRVKSHPNWSKNESVLKRLVD